MPLTPTDRLATKPRMNLALAGAPNTAEISPKTTTPPGCGDADGYVEGAQAHRVRLFSGIL